MIVKIKKYVAEVARYVEHEDGSISKQVETVVLKGQRFSDASVWKQIPRDCKLISHGYIERNYEIDVEKLAAFCKENGVLVE